VDYGDRLSTESRRSFQSSESKKRRSSISASHAKLPPVMIRVQMPPKRIQSFSLIAPKMGWSAQWTRSCGEPSNQRDQLLPMVRKFNRGRAADPLLDLRPRWDAWGPLYRENTALAAGKFLAGSEASVNSLSFLPADTTMNRSNGRPFDDTTFFPSARVLSGFSAAIVRKTSCLLIFLT
jgi:hypothetical protein